jgi:branched-chain amino acid transport system ATP-binding protein
MESILRIIGVTKTFGGLTAINRIDAEVPEKIIYCVIGPNGAGKTTLFNVLTGYYHANKGQVFFRSKDITKLAPSNLAFFGISRTFQNLRLFRKLTALENVIVGFHSETKGGIWDYLISTKQSKREKENSVVGALQLLCYVGLIEKYDVLASDLPYGDQKLLEIARALAMKPTLLLLDEPSSGMNPSETDRLIKLIREINEAGVTIMVIEHNMRVVMEISHRIMVIDHGFKIAEDKPDLIKQNEKVIEAYLGRE